MNGWVFALLAILFAIANYAALYFLAKHGIGLPVYVVGPRP